MNNQYRNNWIRTLLFVAISFLYLMVFENNLCGLIDYSYDSDQTIIEANYQSKLPKIFQSYKGPYSFKQKKTHGSFYLENIYKYRKKLLYLTNNFSTAHLKNQNNYTLSFHPIISILQKNNAWHKSPDEDAFLNEYC